MAEQEIKEQQLPQSPNDTNITQNDLDQKLEELWLIEESVFSFADWKISAINWDSDIDKEYKKWLEKAETLKEKIDLVEWLIVEFRSQFWVNQLFETQKNSKYTTEESKNFLVEWQNKVNEILKQFPHMKDVILSFLQHNFDRNNFYVSFYEKEYKETGNKENIDLITEILKNNYENFSKMFVWDLSIYLKEIDKNTYINDKSKFLSYYFKCWYQWSEWKEWINKVFIIINSSSVTNGVLWNLNDEKLADIVSIWLEEIKKLQDLYEKWNIKNLISFLDNDISPELREKILKIPNIKDIYISDKRGLLNQNSKDNLSKEEIQNLPDDVILLLSQIKDKNISKEILEFFKWIKDSSDYSKIIDFINNDKNGMNSLLNKTSNIVERIYILNIFSNYIDKKLPTNIFVTEHFAWVKDELIKSWVKELKEKYQDNPEMQLKISNFENSKEKPISFLATYYEWNNEKTQQIHPQPAEKPLVSKEKQKGIKDSFSKMWLNVQVSDDWKLLWNNWEKQFSQKIQNWKIEVWANEELVYTTSLWYKFEFNQDLLWVQKLSDITERFNYLNKIWLWYFGEKFKNMLALIPIYLPNQALNLSINEKTWDFLSNYELFNIIIPIFQNIWFIEAGQNIDYLLPQKITDMQMMARVSKIENWGAFIDGKFDAKLFWELLQSKNKV